MTLSVLLEAAFAHCVLASFAPSFFRHFGRAQRIVETAIRPVFRKGYPRRASLLDGDKLPDSLFQRAHHSAVGVPASAECSEASFVISRLIGEATPRSISH